LSYRKTSNPHIFSVGDCTVFFCNGKKMHLESIQNATDQATVAARNIMGNVCYYEAVPWCLKTCLLCKRKFWDNSNSSYDKISLICRTIVTVYRNRLVAFLWLFDTRDRYTCYNIHTMTRMNLRNESRRFFRRRP
jgi:hypothetical protein